LQDDDLLVERVVVVERADRELDPVARVPVGDPDVVPRAVADAHGRGIDRADDHPQLGGGVVDADEIGGAVTVDVASGHVQERRAGDALRAPPQERVRVIRVHGGDDGAAPRGVGGAPVEGDVLEAVRVEVGEREAARLGDG